MGKSCHRKKQLCRSRSRDPLRPRHASPPLPWGFPSAAPPARPVVVVEGAGPLPLNTRFSTRPRSIANTRHCPTQPLFVQRGAGKANTHH